jgi:hypothetical protein
MYRVRTHDQGKLKEPAIEVQLADRTDIRSATSAQRNRDENRADGAQYDPMQIEALSGATTAKILGARVARIAGHLVRRQRNKGFLVDQDGHRAAEHNASEWIA